jgi:polysaccharide export outer membrane protein
MPPSLKASFVAFVILIAVSTLSSCAAYGVSTDTPLTYAGGTQIYPSTVLSDTSLIAIGDSVTMSVWGYPEFSTRSIVKATGSITAPLLGEVFAAGLTKNEFAKALRERLAEYIPGEIKVSLEVANPVPRITVLGAVSRQGSFPATADLLLLEVISNAGGWTPDSDLRYVKITRQSTREGDRRFIEVDLNMYLEAGNARALPLVHPGDVVIIPRSENFVRGVGEYFRDALLLITIFGLLK